MKLYNVLNTSNDKTASGISWLEALEKQLGKKLPKYSINGEEMVGGHMSSLSGQSGVENTEYIAYISKSDNDKDNTCPIIVEYFVRYDDVKKW